MRLGLRRLQGDALHKPVKFLGGQAVAVAVEDGSQRLECDSYQAEGAFLIGVVGAIVAILALSLVSYIGARQAAGCRLR